MRPKPNLTDRQLAILVFIKDHSRDEGMPPTRSEIATQFGFKSSNAAQEHLKALEKKGYIAMRTGFARSIKVLP